MNRRPGAWIGCPGNSPFRHAIRTTAVDAATHSVNQEARRGPPGFLLFREGSYLSRSAAPSRAA